MATFECELCLESYSTNPSDRYVLTPCCKVVYHRQCIRNMFDANARSSCPHCRSGELRRNNSTVINGMVPVRINKKFKICVIGDQWVGKSCLARRYTEDVYTAWNCTLGVDFWVKDLQIGEETLKIYIWDTSGQENFKAITPNYIRGAHGVILAYDLTHVATLVNVQEWLNFVNEYAPGAAKIIVGCKRDMERCDGDCRHGDRVPSIPCRKPTEEQKERVIQRLGLHAFETSARDDINVEADFRDLAIQILQNPVLNRQGEPRVDNNGNVTGPLRVGEQGQQSSSGCC